MPMITNIALNETFSIVLLVLMGLCTVVTAVCVAFDSYEHRGIIFGFRHAGSSFICRICIVVAMVVSVYWTMFVPVQGIEGVVLMALARVVIFACLWVCLAIMFTVIFVAISHFIDA